MDDNIHTTIDELTEQVEKRLIEIIKQTGYDNLGKQMDFRDHQRLVNALRNMSIIHPRFLILTEPSHRFIHAQDGKENLGIMKIIDSHIVFVKDKRDRAKKLRYSEVYQFLDVFDMSRLITLSRPWTNGQEMKLQEDLEKLLIGIM